MGESRAALKARLRGLAEAVAALARVADALADSLTREAANTAQAARSQTRSLSEVNEVISADVLALIQRHAPAAATAADRLAPGAMGLAPESVLWGNPAGGLVGSGLASHLRVGHLEPPAGRVPAVLPLLGTSGWVISSDDRVAAHQTIQATILRLLAAAEPFRVRVDIVDPQLTGLLGLFAEITTRHPSIVTKPAQPGQQVHELLAGLVEVSSLRASRMSQLGAASFDELLASARSADAHRVVVLLDYPAGFDEVTQRDLVRLAATSASRGITFLVHHTPVADASGSSGGSSGGSSVRAEDLLTHLSAVRLNGDRIDAAALPGVTIKRDQAFDVATSTGVSKAVADLADNAALPTVDFATLVPDRGEWWLPAVDELEAVIGLDDRTPARVRFRSGNPPLPHLLVGGAVGQGKSNLLLVLIHALAARYPPQDLAMYLLDFKHGVEFAPLGPAAGREYFLPHLKVLGIHSDRQFGMAVLQHISEELAKRSETFRNLGVTDIAEIPASESRPPRLVVILDEFQMLLDGDDDIASESIRLIERLARLGRAYGVHLVLASQTIEGLVRLAGRREAIFGQIPYRIALKTTQADSQSLLESGNTAAAQLQFRGEAILNANFGNINDNQHVLVAHGNKAQLDTLRRDLWIRGGGTTGVLKPPRIFEIGEPAHLAEALATTTPITDQTGTIHAWAGLPVAVTEEPATIGLRGEPGSGVLVVGDGPREALGVLTGLALSAALATPAGGAGSARPTAQRFILLDALATDAALSEPKAALVEALTTLGCAVEIHDRIDQIAGYLFDLRDRIQTGPMPEPTYLIGLGMHAIPRMGQHVDLRMEAPKDALTQIVRDGPAAGVTTLGWWNRLHVATQQLGYERASIAAHLFLQHPVDGVRQVAGPLARWESEQCRGLLWDGISPEARTVVPFAPLELSEVPRILAEGRRGVPSS